MSPEDVGGTALESSLAGVTRSISSALTTLLLPELLVWLTLLLAAVPISGPHPGSDGLTARIALNSGHECLYMTGAGTTISRLGLPDLGIATLNDMHANAAMIASLDRRVPLIADADTGYGGPIMVARTVAMYMQAGVAGLHIEDQV